MVDCYKMSLPSTHTKIIYQIVGDTLVIAIVAVDKREIGDAYNLAKKLIR